MKANQNLYPPVKFKELGRPLKYTPKQLAEKFAEYVDWCRKNPIVVGTKTENTSVEGIAYGAKTYEEKPRLVSIGGFLVYIGATKQWWADLDNSKKASFSDLKAHIREFCEAFQKEMASANVFNGNIISRLLGLADKQQVDTHSETRVVVETKEQAEKLKNLANLEG